MKHTNKLLVAAMLFLFSCSSSVITSSWKAETIAPKKYKKILVLALINGPDRTLRENMEAKLVAEINELGYSAVCSCDEFGPKYFEDLKEQQALSKLNSSGVDAVLTI